MSLVIVLWAVTVLVVLVGRIRRASWKTVRRYQAGQRAMARLGPEHTREPTPADSHNEPRHPDADDVDDLIPHVRLIEGSRLPKPRSAFRGEPYTPIGRPGWARMADDLDRRPSVSIDSRAWARPPDGPPDPDAGPVRAGGSEPDPATMAALIRVAGPHPRRTRRRLPAVPGLSPLAKVPVAAGVTLVALLATGAAASLLVRPDEASVSAQRAASTHPATSVPGHTGAPVLTRPPAAPEPSARVVGGNGQTATIVVSSAVPRDSAVELSATGPCWIRARAGASGPVLTETTLGPGQTASIPLQDGLWIRLGDPAHVTIVIGGQPVALPGQPGQPLNLVFSRQPATGA